MRTVQAVVNRAGGLLAGTALTGSYQDLLTAPSRVVGLVVLSSCNADIVLSLDGGVTNWLVIPAVPTGVAPLSFVLPFGGLGVQYSQGVSVRHNGVAPTGGIISVGVVVAN